MTEKGEASLGINGLGRIGKLTIWHHVARKHYGAVAPESRGGRFQGTEIAVKTGSGPVSGEPR
jgi:glyceraldehyde 3-phosphate dehydrogenase